MPDSHNASAASFKAAHYQLNNKPVDLTPARRDFYKIWLIQQEGFLTLERDTIHIGESALVFLHPLARYSFRPVVRKRSGYWCIFTGEFLDDASRTSLAQDATLFQTAGQVFFPDEQTLGIVRFYFEQIVREYGSSYPFRFSSARNLVELLIHEGRKLQPVVAHKQQQNAAARLTTRFLNLLEEQYPVATPQDSLKLKKPGDFANELAVHVNHLNAVVQQVTGRSTRQIIAARMLSESKALLYYSDWSVADIAYSLGFEYPNHFTTFFRKNTGHPPLALRK
ncbi:Helix-turn-helix domain-containing protein [Chitinophaga ginsengisegetis]|uniref:Helix-turn-helix domain-containing protein n=1 Tax=Chitinophaga ginsengisegetis TaxID=393003 RepID=A0A1T5NIT6_9BACT|nr:helix-turn-helix domain-containing protein [Chitinophaga ginsengisegetis]SKD00530.1 Helix-turn-helix domain-containing protein [Chitinophaga ginsengisegetis]